MGCYVFSHLCKEYIGAANTLDTTPLIQPTAHKWAAPPLLRARGAVATVHPRESSHLAADQYISSSSSSYSPSSSAVASWYCWYSDTRSFMLDSASVNSISSMPSPVYQ
eukprot:GHVU01207248.1.p2 GENE.GHVU01207248.1~~GHVU01207248.1.p2  ORF type:complete len:109 (-),score=5.95 GHVU01207248.1:112-438(-)